VAPPRAFGRTPTPTPPFPPTAQETGAIGGDALCSPLAASPSLPTTSPPTPSCEQSTAPLPPLRGHAGGLSYDDDDDYDSGEEAVWLEALTNDDFYPVREDDYDTEEDIPPPQRTPVTTTPGAATMTTTTTRAPPSTTVHGVPDVVSTPLPQSPDGVDTTDAVDPNWYHDFRPYCSMCCVPETPDDDVPGYNGPYSWEEQQFRRFHRRVERMQTDRDMERDMEVFGRLRSAAERALERADQLHEIGQCDQRAGLITSLIFSYLLIQYSYAVG